MVLNTPSMFKIIIDRIKIKILVLYRFPKAFNPNIIQCSPITILRYPEPFLFKILGPNCTCILSNLVAVYNLRFTMLSDSFFHNHFKLLGARRIADAPTNNPESVNINNSTHCDNTGYTTNFLPSLIKISCCGKPNITTLGRSYELSFYRLFF